MITDTQCRNVVRFGNRLDKDQVRIVLFVRRFQHIFGSKGNIRLVDDEFRIAVGCEQSEYLRAVKQFAFRVVRVSYPAEILSFQRKLR